MCVCVCVSYVILAGRNTVALVDMTATDAKFDYEYLVKYKSLSYLHVQWLNANEIGTDDLFNAFSASGMSCPSRCFV